MKHLMSAITVLSVMTFATNATAQLLGMGMPNNATGLYTAFNTTPPDAVNRDSVAGFSGALGYRLDTGYESSSHPIRIELQGTQRSSLTAQYNSYDARLQTTTFMANGYYDFNNKSNLTPFVGAGIGAARLEWNDSLQGNTTTNTTVPAYQMMTGISYQPENTKTTTIRAGYRYLKMLDETSITTSNDRTASIENESHSVELGVKFDF